jgi:pyruvate dehydrogenase E2 component (dihydrolipoamide acetyltransferase)
VLRRDVDKALQAANGSAMAARPAVTERAESAHSAGHVDVPHSRLRRVTAQRLTQSKQTAPHFYLRAALRADRLVALRAEINDGAAEDARVSVNDLLVRAVALAHRRVPELNVIWTEEAVRRFDTVDVAVAVATDRGLLTPVVRDVDALPVTALSARIRDLASRAHDNRLRPDELEGGTISVTNLGMYGVDEFAAIINPPHAAILAVGAVRDEVVAEGGVPTVAKVLRVTLSVDHRPVDGVVAARWLAALRDLVEHPTRILA